MDSPIVVKAEDFQNESDVEQKLVYPLLTYKRPYGLGIDPSNIKTKPNIKSFEIEKRKNRKRFYPDYVVVISGFPVLVVEAKPPSEDLEEAYREARLYASEINSLFPHNINPAKKLICTNGKIIIAGFYDSEPSYELQLNDLNPTNTNFLGLLSLR